MPFLRWPRRSSPRLPAAPAYRGPAGRRLYAVGDIHGRADLLDLVLDAIEADADAARRRGLAATAIFLGDYVDRGPDSRGVLTRLSGLKPHVVEWRFLEGNHEAAMMGFIEAPHLYEVWLDYGGDATLDSYGVAPVGELAGMAEGLRKALPADHRAFLGRLDLSLGFGEYFFAHAGIRPGVDLDAQSAQDLLYIREPFLSSTAHHPGRVVHGHTITAEPEIRPSRIGIDTGAYASGRLTCLVVDEEKTRLFTTRPDLSGVEWLS